MENAKLLRCCLLQAVDLFSLVEDCDITQSTSASFGFGGRIPGFPLILRMHAELHYERIHETRPNPFSFGASQSLLGIWLSTLEEACTKADGGYANVDWTSKSLEDLIDDVVTELLTSEIVDDALWGDDTFWEDDPLELDIGDTARCLRRATEGAPPDQTLPASTHMILDNSNHTHKSLFTDNGSCPNPATDTEAPLHDSVPPYGSDDRPHLDDLCHLYANAPSPYNPLLPYQPSRSRFNRLSTTNRSTRLLPTLALLFLATPPLVLAQGAARDVILHITAGVSFATSAALPPLRSFDDLAPAYWISLYSVWGAAFLTGFMLALQRRDNWLQRQVLGWMVIFGAINLLGSLGQNVPTQLDAVAVWGPLALTVSLYVISGLSELVSLDRAARFMGNA